MIFDLDTSFCSSEHNGKARLAYSTKTPDRTPWEELGWAILEQAVMDLAVFARWGIVTTEGKCLPWPRETKRRIKWTAKGPQYFWSRVPRTIASSHGPNDHRQLCAWFQSDDAQQLCDWIGCRLPATEIFQTTIKNHGGLK
jgi:hypothetical protein